MESEADLIFGDDITAEVDGGGLVAVLNDETIEFEVGEGVEIDLDDDGLTGETC